MQISLVSPLIHYFKVFFGYAGRKFIFLCFIIFMAGISEGFGLSIILPVLNFSEQGDLHDSYSQAIYNFLEFSGLGVSLFALLSLLFIAFLLKGCFIFFRGSLTSYIRANLTKKLSVDILNKYREMKYIYYSNTNIGYLNNVITVETARAVAGFGKFVEVIVNLVFIFIYIACAFIINFNLTLLVIVICICLFAMLRNLTRITRKLSIKVSETNAQIQSLLIQTIHNFKYLKATNRFTQLFKQLHKKIDNNRHYYTRAGILSAIPSSIIEPSAVLFLSVLIMYNVGYKGKTMAEVMILLLFFYKAFTRVFAFQAIWQVFNGTVGGVEVLKKASRKLDKEKENAGSYTIRNFRNRIELKDVYFSYDSKQLFSGINMTIPKNKTVGIVGESGTGKTTLFDMLTGLITPQSGAVYMDGIDYREIDLLSLRNLIGYVTQEPVVFNDTISNNISFWECDVDQDICREKVIRAAKLANCSTFINDTENGYDTVIGDKGIKLSGGQCQRVAIAREIFKEPEILIFDEATSSLDTESEMLIQKSINSMMGKCTIIIIAHRLSTIKNCDYIFVLNRGRIIEEGSYNELYRNKNSNFAKMCAIQNL